VHHLYFAAEKRLEKLVDFSYRVLRLKFADEFFILNDFALACILGEDQSRISGLAERQAPWTLTYAVAGYDHFPEKRVAYQEHGIADIAQQYGVVISPEIPGTTSKRMLELISHAAPEPYWKTRFKGGFRDIFFVTTMDRASQFISLMRETAERGGYPPQELGIYLQPVQQGRNCHCEFNLFFDPSNAKESKKVEKVFAEASRALSEAGAFFSRPYGAWAELAYARCPDTVQALRMVKGIVDPDNVLNRGKLCFGEEV
jgi:hypothetical protein